MSEGRLKRRDDNVWRDLGDEVVILDEAGTQVCMLNKTAAMVWMLADGTRTLDEIAKSVCQRFDVGLEAALADVREFSDQLLGADLAEVVGD